MLIKPKFSHSLCFSHEKMRFYALTAMLIAVFLSSASQAQSLDKTTNNSETVNRSSDLYEELPIFELGLGIGGLSQPYYVGTKQQRNFVFPVPVPIYRGDFLKSDEEGVRAELFNSERVKLELSMDFNLAIDSSDVDLRAGMDDIDSRLQIGPSVEVALAKTDTSQWLLNLPLRASIGIGENGVEDSGFTFAPNITYFKDFNFSGEPWRAGLALGPQFGSRKYQNLYYGVDQEFATDTRAAYEADSGYAGSRLLMTLRSQNRDRLWVWFVRYENINGASFDDSPLVETNNGLSVGVIFSKFLFKSKKTVRRKKS